MVDPLSRWLAVDGAPGWGTTAEARRREAPDPEGVELDLRGDADEIRFVRELAKQLVWADPRQVGRGGEDSSAPLTWEAFCGHGQLTAEAIASYGAKAGDGREWSPTQLAWLRRPHFVLLLVFIRLLRHQRQLLNALPARELHHYYQERLGFTPRAGAPDRVTVAFTMAPGAPPLTLKAGTVLVAGLDAQGQERRYRTLTDLSLNHGRVRRLRAIQLERQVWDLATIAAEEPDPEVRLDRMLRLTYGEEGPPGAGMSQGPPASVNNLLDGPIAALLETFTIDGKEEHPQLEPREFQRMMRLVRQRTDGGSDQEWAAINDWLGLENPKNPREFAENFRVSMLGAGSGWLDWKADQLSEVNSVDDLYLNREVKAVSEYLEKLFSAPSCQLRPRGGDVKDKMDTFVRLMTMKQHIDSQWREVNGLLERCGRRRRKRPSWRLDPTSPNSASPDFAGNLAKTLEVIHAEAFPWPKPLQPREPQMGVSRQASAAIPPQCWQTFLDVEALERGFALPLERVIRLFESMREAIRGDGNPDSWAAIQELLGRAHAERWAAARRAVLARCREGLSPEAGFAETLRGVASAMEVGEEERPLDGSRSVDDCLRLLSRWLPGGGLPALQRFGKLLRAPGTEPRPLSWAAVDALLERAQRAESGETPPPLETVRWRQWHRGEQRIDAKAMAAGQTLGPCFWTDPAVEPPDPEAGGGFAVASPLLRLEEGTRTLEVSLSFLAEEGTRDGLLGSLRGRDGGTARADDCAGEPPREPDQPGWGLNQALLVEVSTAEGWLAVPLAKGSVGAVESSKPALWRLTLRVVLRASDPPLAPLEGSDTPRLRMRLRPRNPLWPGEDPWRGFDGPRVASAELRVRVEGLKGVRLQREGVAVNPREPFHPFGAKPEVGNHLYISHPALLEGDLESIRFTGEWVKPPADLAKHYAAYKGWPGLGRDARVRESDFLIDVSLRERHGAEVFSKSARLFAGDGNGRLEITCDPLPPLAPGPTLTAEGNGDGRNQGRMWCWRLAPTDFGHGLYPALTARKAQAFALAISDLAGRQALAMAHTLSGAKPTDTMGSLEESYKNALKAAKDADINPDDYVLPEPYTPLLGGLEVGYRRVQRLSTAETGGGQLLRVHLFGEEEPLVLPPPGGDRVEAEAPPLLASHPHPGELWLELENIRAGQPLALAFQLAEGSARGARPKEAPRWEARRNWRWRPLPVREDGTDGLLHSGIVRVVVPEADGESASDADPLWIRAVLMGPVEAHATILAIQAQAVEAEAITPSGQEVLPPHGITGLEESVPGIAGLHQPFSSRAGRATETEAELRIRAAEHLRHKGRALAPRDYERLLWEGFASQLHTVVCLPAREGRGVEVVVIPNLLEQVPRNLFAPGAPTDQLAAMEGYLRARCPAEGAPVVRNATYMHVTARLWVCRREGVDPAYAERELERAVIRVLSPWCFDAAAEVRLGGEVRALDLVAAVEALPFVAHLERLRLFLVDPAGKPLRPLGREEGYETVLRAPAPDVVLIAARSHTVDFVSAGAPLPSRIGIGVLRVGLDFQVA